MAESGVSETSNNSPSTPPKRRFWRRLFLWGFLAGGGGLLVLLVFLIAVTVPNLRREVAPPEISGPQRVSQSKSSPDHPTSNTLSVSTSTSGTQSFLNLADFPYLSPTMRELAQDWIDLCVETNKTLDSITDPALRARAIAILMLGRENMRILLNRPLEWENLSYEEACQHVMDYSVSSPSIYDPTRENRDAWRQFREKCPEFDGAVGKEMLCSRLLGKRLTFEFFAHNRQWNVAAETAVQNYYDTHAGAYGRFREANTWDEEVYCWRQLEGRGLVCLAARSYQRALENTPLEKRHPSLFSILDGLGMEVIWEMNGYPD